VIADAEDFDGSVSHVQVRVYSSSGQNSILDADFTAPYRFAWNNVAAGSYTLVAEATDAEGAVGMSEPVNVEFVEEVSASGDVTITIQREN